MIFKVKFLCIMGTMREVNNHYGWRVSFVALLSPSYLNFIYIMGLLPDTQNCGLRMRRECRERFPYPRWLAIPTCITARA